MENILPMFGSCLLPSVLWRCWLGGRKGIRPVKNWVVGCWHGYLSAARCRLIQLMPLPLTVSCFSKIQIGFTFLVPAHPGSPGQRAVKRVCVWVLFHLHNQCCSNRQTPMYVKQSAAETLSNYLSLWLDAVVEGTHLSGTVEAVALICQQTASGGILNVSTHWCRHRLPNNRHLRQQHRNSSVWLPQTSLFS